MKNRLLFLGVLFVGQIVTAYLSCQAESPYETRVKERFARENQIIEGEVAFDEIRYSQSPSLELQFVLKSATKLTHVTYAGIRPDNFGPGCAVKIIGEPRKSDFLAKTLRSECPHVDTHVQKLEPRQPGQLGAIEHDLGLTE